MMKQRRPLVQRTPLTRKTPLRNGASQLGGKPQRAKPEGGSVGASDGPVKSRKPGRKSPEEKQCRVLLPVRSGGICEIQVPGVCAGRARVASHRKRRSQSSKAEKWSPTNCLHGCLACEDHLTDFGARPAVRSRGWTVAATVDPAAVPVFRRGVWVWLLASGGVAELDLMEVAAWTGAA